jgi:peptide/nickel transport system substrate-binding protein
VKNWDYWSNTKNPMHVKQTEAGQLFEYYEAQFAGFDDKSLITKVEALDANTVKFTLAEPQVFFLNNLAIFSFGISSPTALEKNGADSCKNPVGTGPFKFVEWKPNEQVTLARNDGYWDAASKAKVARVIIRNIGDNAQRLAALKAGEVDAIEGVNTDDIKGIEADSNLQILYRPPNTTGYIAFNYHVKEFRDKNVREAFAHAINKKTIAENVYSGTVLEAKEFQPPSLWGYNPDIQDYDYNPEKAKELLTAAGFPNGLSEITWDDGTKQPLEFWYMSRSRPYFPNPKDAAEAIAADFAKAGIKVNLNTVEWAQYLDKRANGQLPLYMLGWTGDNGDPDNFVCYFFCKPDLAREGFYTNATLNDLLTKAGSSTDRQERTNLYKQAEQEMHNDISRIFVVHTTPPVVLSKKVQGYVVNPTSTEFFNTVTVSK